MDVARWVLVVGVLAWAGGQSQALRLSHLEAPPSEHLQESPQASENMCTFCDIIASMFEQSEDDDNDSKLAAAKDKLCHELPSPLDSQCASYVDQRGLGMLKLMQGGWSVEKVCARFAKCSGRAHHAAPPRGVQQNGHVDEHDMPSPDELGKPELVPGAVTIANGDHSTIARRQHALHLAEIRNAENEDDAPRHAGDGEDKAAMEEDGFHNDDPSGFVEVGVTTQGLGGAISGSSRAAHDLWNSVFHTVLAWINRDKDVQNAASTKASKANAAAAAAASKAALHSALQLEAGAPDKADDHDQVAAQFLNAVTHNTSALSSDQLDLLASVSASLESRRAHQLFAQQPPHQRQGTTEQALVQEQGGVARADADDLVARVHALAEEVLHVQLGTGVGAGVGVGFGGSPVWPVVVKTYWSMIFTYWIKTQWDGTGLK